jgi:hypothetical protein
MPESTQETQKTCQSCGNCAAKSQPATKESEVSTEFKRPDDTEGGTCD